MAIYREGVIHYAQPAGVNLTGKLFHFAAVDSSGNIVLSGAGGNVIGVIMEEATIGNAATVQVDGIAKVKTSGNVSAGARVQSDANGQCQSLQSGVAVGIALTGAIAGDIIPVKMF
jgi:hypothetical protein